jgi:hypothetical protein
MLCWFGVTSTHTKQFLAMLHKCYEVQVYIKSLNTGNLEVMDKFLKGYERKDRMKLVQVKEMSLVEVEKGM